MSRSQNLHVVLKVGNDGIVNSLDIIDGDPRFFHQFGYTHFSPLILNSYGTTHNSQSNHLRTRYPRRFSSIIRRFAIFILGYEVLFSDKC